MLSLSPKVDTNARLSSLPGVLCSELSLSEPGLWSLLCTYKARPLLRLASVPSSTRVLSLPVTGAPYRATRAQALPFL